MASTVQNLTDIESRSKAFADRFAQSSLDARKHLAKKCLCAAKKVTELIEVDSDIEIVDGKLFFKKHPSVLKVQLDAAKTALKLNGIGTEEEKKAPHVVIHITHNQALKIEQFAQLEGD